MKRKILIITILMIFMGNMVLANNVNNINVNTNKTKEQSTVEKTQGEESEEKEKEQEQKENVEESEKTKEKEEKENREIQNEEEENNIQILSLEDEKSEKIKEGTYRISVYGNSYCHMALEIENGSKQVEANVGIGQWFNRNNEKNKFKISYDEASGYYTIKSVNSGNVLDVQNGGMTPGTNVWQHKPNGTDAQKWKIEKNADGSYSFVSKKNGLYLDVQNKDIISGGNIQVNTKSNGSSQKFSLICLDDKPQKVIENGTYKIALKADNNIVIQTENASKENGGNINTGKWINGTSNIQKKFKITYQEDDGYYTIESTNAGKVWDAQNGGMEPGTNIWQYEGNYTDAQRWKIEKNADGSYSMSNKKSGLYLDVAGEVAEGRNVQINQKTDSNRQKFDLILLDEKPEKTIENGIYRISIFGNSYCHMALEIENGSKQVEANVGLGQWFNRNNEKNKFEVTYDETSGYYTIKSVNSGNVLDVQNGGMMPGTNVWQHKPNGTDAQKWKIEKNEDGSYSIVSKKNGLYLNVQNGNVASEGNIEVNNGNNQTGQKFQFIALDKIPEQVIEDGVYKIETLGDSNQVVEIKDNSNDNGANVQIGNWTEILNGNKKFQLTYNKDDGYYTIEAIHSGKVWDAQNGGMTSGTNIWQYAGNYTDAQRWKIEKNQDGSYSLVNKKSGLYLNVKNGNIEIANKTGDTSQKFKLSKVDAINVDEYIEAGTYKIVVASNRDLAIDVNNASREKTANIVLGKEADTIRNEFNLIPDGNGYYVISSINSGNVLDVQNGGMTSGTNVWQHGNNGTDAQKWIIRHNKEDDTYSIISKKNGLYIDVQNGNMTNGANIQVCVGNNTKAQKFKFIKQEGKTEKYIEDGLYKITTKINNEIGFDIESASKNDGGVLQIWKYEKVAQQQFNVIYKNGYYYIININSNKAMQATDSKILQYEVNYENDNQKWILKTTNGASYSFISKATGKCITIPNANVTNGMDLQMENYYAIEGQLFIIENAGLYIDEAKYPGIKQKIDELKAKHPNWNFEILYTGINFYDAVYGEYKSKKNCLVDTSTYRGEWIAENPYSSGVWYSASEKGIAYFMDTRNFLNDVDIFQFLDLNGYNEEAVTTNGIQQQVNGSFLENYANDIRNACYRQNVNPYYVIARLFQEQGRKGTTIGTGMDGGNGKTYYNPFNIGAQVGNDYETALAKAKEKGWDSMEKAIVGGIDFLKANWLENYQNTLYQNKFDIDTRNGTSLYSHEYMQNLSAAYSEARTLRSCYATTGKTESKFTFIIPVYENIPTTVSPRPANSDEPISSNSGPMDVQVINVSSSLRLRESASASSTILAELKNGTKLLSIKRAVNGNWHQVVTDDGLIGYVSGDYLQFIADRTNCNTKKVVKTADGIGIKIRIGPSIYVDQAGVLPDGEVVTCINTGTYYIDGYAWDRVILDTGRQVFAPAAYLK